MIAALLEIVLKSGRTFDGCTLLVTSFRSGDRAPVLSFMAEGSLWTIPAADVQSVKLRLANSAAMPIECATCRQPLPAGQFPNHQPSDLPSKSNADLPETLLLPRKEA